MFKALKKANLVYGGDNDVFVVVGNWCRVARWVSRKVVHESHLFTRVMFDRKIVWQQFICPTSEARLGCLCIFIIF